MKLGEWNNFSLDLSKMIKQDPGSIYRIEFTYKKEYSLYPCDGIVPQIPEEATLERFDNKISEEVQVIIILKTGTGMNTIGMSATILVMPHTT